MIQAFCLLFFSMNAHASVDPALELQGKIKLDPEAYCSGGKAELYLSEKDSHTLLYQVDVIPNGSFEFHLKEGKYDLKVISMKACEAQATVVMDVLRPLQKVTLTLAQRVSGGQK